MSEAGSGAGEASAGTSAPAGAATTGAPAAAPSSGPTNGASKEPAGTAAPSGPPGEQEVFDLEAHGDRIVEYMVNGEKVRGTLRDFNRDVMRSKAAYKKMDEAAATKREAEEIIRIFREDPGHVIEKYGGTAGAKAALKRLVNTKDPSLRQAVAEAFDEMMAEDAKPPAQRQRESLEERERRLEEEREAFRREQEEARLAASTELVRRRLTRSFKGALEKVGLPVNPATIAAMAERAAEMGNRGLSLQQAETIEECALLVREAEDERVGSVRTKTLAELAEMPVAELVKVLGPNKLREVREYQLAQVQGEAARAQSAPRAPAPRPTPAAPRFRTPEEVEAAMEARRRGR